MREINLIVIHCSGTRTDKPFTERDLERSHRLRGFNGTGYHYYIRRDGSIKTTRPVERVGAHAKNYNAHSIGVCYEGGLNAQGKPTDTRTQWQRSSLRALIRTLQQDFPGCKVTGHRDLSPDLNGNGVIETHEWLKQCPCFNVAEFLSKENPG